MLIPRSRFPSPARAVGWLLLAWLLGGHQAAGQQPSYFAPGNETSGLPAWQQATSAPPASSYDAAGPGSPNPLRSSSGEPSPWADPRASTPLAARPESPRPRAEVSPTETPPFETWQAGRGPLWQVLQQTPKATREPRSSQTAWASQPAGGSYPSNRPAPSQDPASAPQSWYSLPMNGATAAPAPPMSQPTTGWQNPSGPPSFSPPTALPAQGSAYASSATAGWNAPGNSPVYDAHPVPTQPSYGTPSQGVDAPQQQPAPSFYSSPPPLGGSGSVAAPVAGMASPAMPSPPAQAAVPTAPAPAAPMAAAPQVPAEDPAVARKKRMQKYHIGEPKINYSGAYDLSKMSLAPRWKGPVPMISPDGAAAIASPSGTPYGTPDRR